MNLSINRFRLTTRICVGFITALAIAAAVTLAQQPPQASGYSVKMNKNTKLDGKTVMSPAAERITTVKPDGGKTIGPGIKVDRNILIQNRAKSKTDFTLDIAQVVGSNAENIVEVRNGVRQGAAAWVELEKTTITLKPGETATIGLKIDIPTTVKPGSKAFAVTATQAPSAEPQSGAGVTPIFRQVAIFILELPGDAPIKGNIKRAEITDAKETVKTGQRSSAGPLFSDIDGKPRLTLTVEYKNDGERLLTPQGKVEVKDLFGRVVGKYEIRRFTVYPEGEAGIQLDMRKIPFIGIFSTKLTLESDAGVQSRQLGRFIMLPWWSMLIITLLWLYFTIRIARWRSWWLALIPFAFGPIGLFLVRDELPIWAKIAGGVVMLWPIWEIIRAFRERDIRREIREEIMNEGATENADQGGYADEADVDEFDDFDE